MSVQIAKRRFNVAEYYRMGETGILAEDDRVELINGEIVKMTPIGLQHASCVNRINSLFHRLIGGNVVVSVQNPVRLDDFSEPQPDVALLKPRDDFYSTAHPTPADVLLIIEVADTSVEYDRDVKLPLYAASAIAEVWLADVVKEMVEVYKNPKGGIYRQARYVSRGESLSPDFNPDLTIGADEILG